MNSPSPSERKLHQLSVRLERDIKDALERVALRERRTLASTINALLARELSLRGELEADRREARA
jgi:hypothetical protein